MTFGEMMKEVRQRYSLAICKYSDSFSFVFDNQWAISLGYGTGHFSSHRGGFDSFRWDDIETVEVSIARPDHSWFVAEGMVRLDGKGPKNPKDPRHVFAYRSPAQVLAIFEYIAGMHEK